MLQTSRIPFRVRGLRAAATLAYASALAGVLTGTFAGCAQIEHRQPIVQQPMTAAPPVPPQLQPPGSIYNPGYAGHPLFEDQRPRNTGDILTIVIAENINATKSSAAAAGRNGTTNMSVPTAGFLKGLFNHVDLSASGANTFGGSGGANASNTFNGTITVTVTNVLPNGNLVVSGEKQMLINQGNEFVRFSGVVNPNTVSGANTVLSTQVADARIEYSAKGYINEAETMGWLQRFFLNIAPW
ncbi:flagellar basal body L-ring protein FlgH [Trinickia diaoshuihuensis]|jgi:flagellar L-ring protein precursor FlgH|uniref:flagellar basal body L-ring protein FlgH n=1 Tax=Trinickia diaoshuihuensis TaxID=2292265 RepID=UPI000E2564EE|nr:flagellar basal body L-ring protein FlgH [Trinickia diaoshuihuensis]